MGSSATEVEETQIIATTFAATPSATVVRAISSLAAEVGGVWISSTTCCANADPSTPINHNEQGEHDDL
ncbi:MAG: hypothetical protein LBB37_04830 [Endomicrobium sp.]|nr:hypothetical protein [Endomicrobium sp.]